MTNAGPANALARVRSAIARSDDPRTDGQLLEAFRDRREPDAFTALVYRHGPRVWAVCQRITRHTHDADDAFQAVFLVLARRAADIRPPDAVGAWLYGVAFRTAQDARAMATRRRARQTPTAELPEVPFESVPTDSELASALDAEIAGLPEQYRAAVVLCELDGLARRDAAKRLGIAEGTLSSRLAEARKRLATALKRKGFALPASLAAVLATGSSGSASVYPLACRLGHLAAAGEQLPAGAPVALANIVSKVMFLQKLKLVAILAAFGAVLCAGGWFTLHRSTAAEDKPTDAPKVQATKPVEAKPLNRMAIWKQNKAVLIDADGKNEKVLFELAKGESIREPKLSPDGKMVAYVTANLDAAPQPNPREAARAIFTVKLLDLVNDPDGKKPIDLKRQGQFIAWSPDGKELLVTDFEDRPNNGPKDGPPKSTTTVIDVTSKKETSLTLPAGQIALAFAPDGKKLVTMFFEIANDKPTMATCLLSRDGKEVTTISDPAYLTMYGRLSPDGKTLLSMGIKAPDKVPERPIDQKARLFIQKVGGKAVELPDVPMNAELQGFCWSPDGKKIGYTWRQVHAEKVEAGKVDDRETESHLCICDADGKNHKTILTEKGQGQYHITLSSLDWR